MTSKVYITVSILILIMLFFILGVLVGRYDRTIEPRAEEVDIEMPDQRVAARPVQGEGVQTSPRLPVRTSSGTETTPGEPRYVKVPSYEVAAPEDGTQTTAASATPPPSVTPQIQQPAESVVPTQPPSVSPATQSPPPTQPAQPVTPAPAPPPATAPPVQQPVSTGQNSGSSASGLPNYGVQLRSFGAENRRQAEAFQLELSSQHGIKADLVASPDGKYLRAIVGSYPDRDSADASRIELSKIKEFADAFVQVR